MKFDAMGAITGPYAHRILEDILASAPELADFEIEVLRGDLNAIQRQIGATPWPTPHHDPARTTSDQ